MRRFLLLAIIIAGVQVSLLAQGNNNVTVQSLLGTHVDTILKYHLAGEGVELTNGKFNNSPGIVTDDQIGTFNRNNNTQFPFATGLVMTTGAVSVAAGPNSQTGASGTAGDYTDATLQQYATNTVTNCAALDFDFLAYADTFAFNYVFGSEEYPDYVCADYNDIFIFLLTGPDPTTGLTTTKNVAIIPGTISATNPQGLPVSINNVNGGIGSFGNAGPDCYGGTYAAYYISNGTNSQGVQYNGTTVQLSAEGNILACETYHMHLAIGNVMDYSYDSGVFLEGKSFQSSVETHLLMRDVYCLHEDIVFDYISDEVDTIFVLTPKGDTLWNEPFTIHDADVSDSGLYYLYAHSALPCVDLWTYDSLNISVINTFKPDLGEDQWLCTGEVATITSNYDENSAGLYWNTGDTTSSIEVITSGEYILDVEVMNPATHTNCRSSDTVLITFWDLPQPDFEADITSGCTPVISRFTNLTNTASDTISCAWYFFDENFNIIDYSSEHEPIIHFNSAGNYSVKLVITTAEGCKDSITKWNYIITAPQPELDFIATPEICMMNETNGEINFTAVLSSNVIDNPDNNLVWRFGDGDETLNETTTSHTYSTWGDYVVTLSLTTESGCGDSVSHLIVIEDDLIFPNVITPNGDGINDVWAIENLNTDINPEDPDEYRHNEVRITDRWGKVVFHTKNYDTWAKDGQIYMGSNPFTGDNLSDGTYYYTFIYKGKAKTTQWHGSITIIR
ncbi:MAG: choice-of-anchor L domain-containing protein [Bacteroidales bacterium]|nr:choice-of-anchor L domain-containing protein [Bacteroidales bacterium]